MGYTVSDLLGVGAGFLLYALFAFAPGYTFGWLTDVFEFRQRRLATRIAAAVPLSIGLTPITTYFLWRCWLPLVWIVFGASGVVCAILLARDVRVNKLHLSRDGWIVAAIAAGWLVVGTFSLIDLQFGNRLYFPVSAHDHSTRAAFTSAIARFGIPPHNPFFFAGQPAPLRYHYFWLIPSALVNLLGGPLVSARLSLIAGTLWCGLGLFGIIALYLRFFQSKGADQIERRTLIAISLLAVTGLDILPIILADLIIHIFPCIEWWNEHIAAWITTALWVPHDLAALIAGFTGFLLVWDTAGQNKRRLQVAGVIGGGLAFASCTGSSIYLGIALAASCTLWLATAFLKGWRRRALNLLCAGTLAAALLLPYLIQLKSGTVNERAAPPSVQASFPLSLTVRGFTIPDVLFDFAKPAQTVLLNLALLPLNYFLEFGFYFVVACIGVRGIRRRGLREETEWAAATLGAGSLLICTFTKSSVISSNDLGWISALVVQFILLLWATEMWNEGVVGFGASREGKHVKQPRTAPRLIAVTLVLGIMGSCYEICLQRAYPIVADFTNGYKYPWLSLDRQLGQRTFEVRRAYEEMDRILPANAIVQAGPVPLEGNVAAELYSGRQMVADVGDCGTAFGGSKQYCNQVILPRLNPLFDDRQPVSAKMVSETCRQFSITALFFKDTDPVWRDKSSWIWKTSPLLSNDFVRVIQCSGIDPEFYLKQLSAESRGRIATAHPAGHHS
jgi:hypothetical protein